MSRKSIIIAVAGALMAAGAVAAISAPGLRGGWHDGPMMGGDGGLMGRGMHAMFGRSLTKEAFDTRTRERFARLDKNSDGVIDTGEIEAALSGGMAAHRQGGGGAQMAASMLRRLGAGADGKVTKEKFRAEISRRFAEADLNNDGRIDDNDLPPMLRGRNVLANAGAGAGAGRDAAMLGWIHRLGVVAKDGAISREDVLAAADRQFDRLDRNKDGSIDKADFDLVQKEMVDYRVKRFLHRYGADKDGRVTREQFQAKANEVFARLDVNGDGVISRDEMPGGGRRAGGMRGRWGAGMMGESGMGESGMGQNGMGGRGAWGGGPRGHRMDGPGREGSPDAGAMPGQPPAKQ